MDEFCYVHKEDIIINYTLEHYQLSANMPSKSMFIAQRGKLIIFRDKNCVISFSLSQINYLHRFHHDLMGTLNMETCRETNIY